MRNFRIDYTSTEMAAFYPSSCLSGGCGYISSNKECIECACRPNLDAFNNWVMDNNAVVSDPIWSPNIYIAKRR